MLLVLEKGKGGCGWLLVRWGWGHGSPSLFRLDCGYFYLLALQPNQKAKQAETLQTYWLEVLTGSVQISLLEATQGRVFEAIVSLLRTPHAERAVSEG